MKVIIPNPKKILNNINIVLEYWNTYKSENNNYRYNNDALYLKSIIFADLESNIYAALKEITNINNFDNIKLLFELQTRYIAYMIHNLTNEFYTDRYIVTPFEQFLSFLDLSQYIYADYKNFIKLIEFIINYKEQIFINKNYSDITLHKKLYEFISNNMPDIINNTLYIDTKDDFTYTQLTYYNFPLIYYALHNLEKFIETKNILYLPIVILLRYPLNNYIQYIYINNIGDDINNNTDINYSELTNLLYNNLILNNNSIVLIENQNTIELLSNIISDEYISYLDKLFK